MNNMQCCIFSDAQNSQICEQLKTSLTDIFDVTVFSIDESPRLLKRALVTAEQLHLVILVSSDVSKQVYSLLHMLKKKRQFACAYFGSTTITGPRLFDLQEPTLNADNITISTRILNFLGDAAFHSQKETKIHNAKIHLLTQLTQLSRSEITSELCVSMLADSLAQLCQSDYLYICDDQLVCQPALATMQCELETPAVIQQAIDEKKVKVLFDETAADIVTLRKVQPNIAGSLTFPIICNTQVLCVIHCYLPQEMLDSITLETISLVEQACHQLQIILERLDAQKNLELQHQELAKTLTELQTTKSQLYQTEKLAAIGQLAAGIAHEIKNPLAFVASNFQSLMQYTDTMADVLSEYSDFMGVVKEKATGQIDFTGIENKKKESDVDFILEDVDDLLADSKDGIDRIREIIDNLLLFSRKDIAETKEYNLAEGLQSTLKILNTKLKDNIVVTTDYTADIQLSCQPGAINQVFLNILQNAVDAMDGKGEIAIRTRVEDNMAIIVLRDNGPGIPDNVLANIFDPFFTTKPVGKGTGLGLSISHGIIEQHGGLIKINTQIGKYTEFVISLPVSSKWLSKKNQHTPESTADMIA